MKFTSLIDLPRLLGMQHQVTVHDYFPVGYQAPAADSIEWFMQDRAYIQASLHADELPGILLNHHLIKMLDKASELGAIEKPITLVPFANPIGLNQILLGSHIGRFSLSTGVNFNREWVDVTSGVAQKIENNLTDDADFNVALIRKALVEETNLLTDSKIENVLKRELFKKAIISSVVLDLHCDTGLLKNILLILYYFIILFLDAVMHMYTHDRLWPQMADLASFIDSKCTIIAPESGGNPFDEACSCVWATLADKFSSHPIPMACQSVTVELRGENQVYDELAIKDAEAIFNFLTKRGFIKNLDNKAFDLLSPEKLYVSPLTGVDMINVNSFYNLRFTLLLIYFIIIG